eukprot:g12180.t1
MDSFSDDAELSLSQILEAMIDEEEEKPHLQLEETHVVQEESDGAGRAECAQNQAQDEDGCRTPDRCENEPHSQVNGALRTPKKKGWRMDFGPRGMGVQVYYMPPGVWRGPGRTGDPETLL